MRFDADGLAAGMLYYDPLAADVSPGDCIVVDFRSFSSDPLAFSETAEKWLNRLPCPSIALTKEPMRLKGFDLSLYSEEEVERLEKVVSANPIASTVLVQTLRLVEQLPVHAGLVVESLAFATLQQGEEFRRWLASRPANAKKPDQAATNSPPLLIEREGARLNVCLNRPASRNEIGVEMRDALFEAFTLAAMDTTIREVHVRGAGDSFSIGGALGEFGEVSSGVAGHFIRSERLPARMVADHAHKFHFHLHGACIGAGIEMASFGARVTTTPNTFMRLPEVSMGLIPGAGGCVGITKRIGRQGAAWMMLTGQQIGAKTALAWGLVDRIET